VQAAVEAPRPAAKGVLLRTALGSPSIAARRD
jgi:hypothetical protein